MAGWSRGATSRSMPVMRPSRHARRWKRDSPGADAGALHRLAANRLDIVAVGIQHERPVVVFIIVRTQPRRSVVLASGCERRSVKLLYGFPIPGREGDMG